MPLCPTLVSFAPGTTIRSADVNSNNTALRDTLNISAVLVDVARTITVGHTISLGAITTDVKLLDMSASWQNVTVTFTGLKVNITDTASAAASLLLDLQVGGASKFKVSKAGDVTMAGDVTVNADRLLFVGGATVKLGTTDNFPLTVVTNNTDCWQFTALGNLVATADGIFDLGGSAANRPRDVHIARFVTVGTSVRIGTDPGGGDPLRVGGGITVNGAISGVTTLTATTLAGTLSTAAQPNVTSLGVLVSLGVTNQLVVGSATGATAGLVVGSGALAFTVEPDEIRVASGGVEGAFHNTATVSEIGTRSNHPFRLFSNNAVRWSVETTGHFVAPVDNTYDLGASGATRPRSGYFGTSVVVGTDPGGLQLLRVGGTARLTDSLRLDNGGADGPGVQFVSTTNEWEVDNNVGDLRAFSGGTVYLALSTTRLTLRGNLLFMVDNSFDIGASGATRPRDLFLGRTLNISQGTITTDLKAVDISVTWNAGGVTFTPIRLNVIDTASAAASLLADLQVGGASRFTVRKGGVPEFKANAGGDMLTGVGRRAAEGQLNVGNSAGGADTVLKSIAVAAGSIPGSSGSLPQGFVRIVAWGRLANNANNKSVKVKVSTTTLVTLSSTLGSADCVWYLEVYVVPVGTSVEVGAICNFFDVSGNTGSPKADRTQASIDLASAQTFDLVGASSGAADVVLEGYTVEYAPGRN
jgi:hypothetical protein